MGVSVLVPVFPVVPEAITSEITDHGISALIEAMLKDLGKLEWTDVVADMQEHVAMQNLLSRGRANLPLVVGEWKVS
jgi:hypothetical protein